MAKLVYGAICSLDGFVADENGKWDWSIPDDEVHSAVNDLERGVGTHLFGRRMYDVLVAWETMDVSGEPQAIRDYQAIWQASDKVVFSRSLEAPRSERTRIEREFDPQAVAAMKEPAERDISIGGPQLAALAFEAGLVDELYLFVSPVIVGGGNPALPAGVRVDLELLDEHRFANGAVQLRYSVASRSQNST